MSTGTSHLATAGFRFGWLLTARAAALLLCVLSASLGPNGDYVPADNWQFVLWTALAIIALSAGSWAWARRHFFEFGHVFVWLQLFLDLGLVTEVVYVSGGAVSPLLFLYLPLVMMAAFLLSRTAALAMAGLSTTAYVCLLLALEHKLLLPFDGGPYVGAPSNGLMLQIVGLCSGMVLIAVATSYLVKAIRSRDQLVAQSQRDLLELTERQRNLIHSIPEAIITTDSVEIVRGVNQAATTLLGVEEESIRGKSLTDILRSLDRNATLHRSGKDNYGVLNERLGEFTLEETAGRPRATIRYYARPFEGGLSADSTALIFVFQDVTKLRSIEEQLELQDRMARLLSSASSEERAPSERRMREFIGESVVMRKVFALIERVAHSDATVLIHGESGTGKELVAKSIHLESPRSNGPFVAVNCGAIPEHLLESEFFGHKKGAFTSAHADHSGFFQRATGGTIFLDEIGELPVQMQAKLLRALQEKSIRPIGGERDLTIDVRVLAATNRNLKREIDAGNFREDLFYRLNVININLPPLRDRRDDIPLLVDAILKRLGKRNDGRERDLNGSSQPIVPPQTMQLLTRYNYPGNVRELENILERAYVLGGTIILPEHLPETVREYCAAEPDNGSVALRRETQIIVDESISFPVDLDSVLGVIERRYLESALLQTNGAKKKAAELLGINFRSFRYRLQKFGIADD